jgi:Carboxypeptidase regulatory-like domain
MRSVGAQILAHCIWSGLLLTSLATSLHGQAVQGVVVRADSDEQLSGALVDLVAVHPDAEDIAEVETGADGRFEIIALEPGNYVLRVRLLGYKPQFAIMTLEARQVVTLRVNLAPMVVALDAITVYGMEANTAGQQEFWSRRDLKWNWSFDYTEFEQMGAVEVRDVIRFGIPGGAFPRGCFIVWRDGVRMGEFQMDNYPLDWVYGIEIYRYGHDVPIRYRASFGGYRCGAVLIWSREPGRGRQ